LAPERSASSPTRHPAWRYVRLRDCLEAALELAARKGSPVTHLAYESVVGRPARAGVEAGHVYGGLRAVLFAVAWDHEVPLVGVSVQAVKLEATGKGNAPKEEVTRAAQLRLGRVVGPDEGDAWWVAVAALGLLDHPPETRRR
jgi:hypothetical protein